MSAQLVAVQDLFNTTGVSHAVIDSPDVAHLTIHHNEVLSSHVVPGLVVDVEQITDGVSIVMSVKAGTIIKKPIHLCFGMLPETGIQKIVIQADIGENTRTSIFAHCTFPNAIDITHVMDAKIKVGAGAEYSYFERHIHGMQGGVKVIPKAIVEVEEGAKFSTRFELIKGYVGKINIDYETTCKANGVLEMDARINGKGNDDIKIREVGYLVGEGARGVLTSRIAVRNNARAEVYNKLIASAPYARGHVDCKEIVQDNGIATAVPIVEVSHPKAHVTHEAAIGSVDSKQLQTLMARGLSEDEAVELIIQGLLT